MTVRCSFYILDRDTPGNSHALYLTTTRGGESLILDEAPAVGDLLYLSGEVTNSADPERESLVKVSGTWRVLARAWCPASYGSQVWQTGPRPTEPIALDVMLERSIGLFDASHYAPADGTAVTS